MMGFTLAMSIIAIIVGVVGAGVALFYEGFRKYAIGGLVLLIVGIYGILYVRSHEQAYYNQYGNPYSSFGQVQAVSEGKLTLRSTDYHVRGDGNFIIKINNVDVSSLKEGDIVRLVYIDGIFYNYLIKYQRYIPEK